MKPYLSASRKGTRRVRPSGPSGLDLRLKSAALTSVVFGLGWLASPPVRAAPPESTEQQVTHAVVEGRVLEAGGSRAPVSGAVILLVDAGEDARPGKPARTLLDPDAIAWSLQTETDSEGRFAIPNVPIGNVRIIVVAGGYERLEQWAAAPSEAPISVYLRSERGGAYRTEVVTARETVATPDHVIDAQAARHHAGGADDPLIATLNLPGVARSPGGLGLMSLRGGNPTETGYYLDGHPVPRAFHVVPIASVVSPPMVDRVELSPGNYGPAFGSFSGGLVQVMSRQGRRDGVHGQAHLDLFDLGATMEAPVGPGSVHVGWRRSHIDGVLRAAETVTGPTGILLPTYWDYLGRFDIPVRAGHRLTLRALGAGDSLRDRGPDPVPGERPNLFAFSASFHRFDLDYRVADGDWRVLLSPSLRLDSSRIEQEALIRRDANVFSGRVEVENDVREWLTVQVGSDLVYERWRRRERVPEQFGGDFLDSDQLEVDRQLKGEQLRLGLWLAPALRVRNWSIVPSLRMNLFSYASRQFLGFDPRLEVRGQVHRKAELFAKLGLYSTPVVLTNGGAGANLITNNGTLFGGVADVPNYLIAYFDPGIEGEIRNGSAGVARTVQASTGVEAQLPWELTVRGTVFWREVLPTTVPYITDGGGLDFTTSRRRSMGVEVLLRRALGSRVDGWVGYTLMSAAVQRGGLPWEQGRLPWLPAQFDQRHNFVLLASVALPRGFRFGARFRVVSGNPLETVLGAEMINSPYGTYYRPIRGERGTTYQPVFHQLDLRIDKRWPLRRVAVTAYLDVQNVYDRRYPEVLVYSRDWAQQSSLIGLPIYPSFGVQVDY